MASGKIAAFNRSKLEAHRSSASLIAISPLLAITTFLVGGVPSRASILVATSIPSMTLPKTTWRPSSHDVFQRVRPSLGAVHVDPDRRATIDARSEGVIEHREEMAGVLVVSDVRNQRRLDGGFDVVVETGE